MFVQFKISFKCHILVFLAIFDTVVVLTSQMSVLKGKQNLWIATLVVKV